jgi:hypothetical protein
MKQGVRRLGGSETSRGRKNLQRLRNRELDIRGLSYPPTRYAVGDLNSTRASGSLRTFRRRPAGNALKRSTTLWGVPRETSCFLRPCESLEPHRRSQTSQRSRRNRIIRIAFPGYPERECNLRRVGLRWRQRLAPWPGESQKP